ncbi:NAD(P)/FAD-dependent oxidoreductase [Pseudomonas gingeri]|uniref:NAD(P)/FAD-dependent oxidoreductase n=1 Tax=Pseudomonas gingeri TaxID=117681 RepID=UPI0015A443BA|nr:FAD-dependent oxidoreductase [Pseudomonas gingeri]NWD06854.1 FAD-binding oxidoreductase [Pseudomonas gingeri]NWE31452.1 FAD-binding oxidoreductase [Pseudomonas gingeri]NWE57530.1 FAD-binding oxidoreductase [Pseudomonas gingeri]NWE99918.1 FAD-binding oxidoreductase [Pseudomonas gingeri]
MNNNKLHSILQPLDMPAWTATAEPAPTLLALQQDLVVDVAIIGAGFTGLSAAIELASHGVTVAVLEAGRVGDGASGRNGGQINPGLKLDPHDVLAKHPAIAEHALDFSGKAPDKVFEIVARYDIQCHIKRTGWLMPAHRESAEADLERRANGWINRGVKVQTVGREETRRITGSAAYTGAIIDPRGGNLQPLSYVRGLARAAVSEGAKVFERTRIQTLVQQSGSWVLTTASGAKVRANRVILATNGYTDGLWPGLEQTIIPVHSFQIATVPLEASVAASILPEGHHAADTRRLIQYFRKDPAGRFFLGGEGKAGGPKTAADFSHLYRLMLQAYPQLAGISIEFAWSGRLAVTPDYLPHVHEPAPGISAVLGCQGRGIAMMTAMGQSLAAHLLDSSSVLGLPVTRLKRIPFHGLNQLYAAVASSYFRVMDVN